MRVIQGVEDVEELLLRALLSRQELDVVDEQDVGPAGFLVEVLDDGIVVVRVLNRADNFVGELFARRVDNLLVGCLGQHGVRDALQQVGLAQPDAAVNVQRVVDIARVARDGVAGGERKAVACADHEVVKRVPPVQDNGIVVRGLPWLRSRFRRGFENLDGDSGRASFDGVDGLLDDIVVSADDPVAGKIARNTDRQRGVVLLDGGSVLEPHLERWTRELLAENVEKLLPRIRRLFFHVSLPCLCMHHGHSAPPGRTGHTLSLHGTSSRDGRGGAPTQSCIFVCYSIGEMKSSGNRQEIH